MKQQIERKMIGLMNQLVILQQAFRYYLFRPGIIYLSDKDPSLLLSTEIEIEVFSYYSNIHLMTMVTLAIT
jgi:hypothetical protein